MSLFHGLEPFIGAYTPCTQWNIQEEFVDCISLEMIIFMEELTLNPKTKLIR